MSRQITTKVKRILKNEMIPSRTSSCEVVTFEERIKQDYLHGLGHNSIRELVTKRGKQFADDMKRRYDLLFASQIVSKMSDNGLVSKEDCEKLLQA